MPQRKDRIRVGLTVLLLATIAGGLMGEIFQDRNIILAMLLYIPLFAVGLFAIIFDLVLRGRSIPKLRFVMSGIGLALVIGSAIHLTGRGSDLTGPTRVRVLQWNIMRSGQANPSRWKRVCDAIVEQQPDIVALHETTDNASFVELRDRLGSQWHLQHYSGPNYSGFAIAMLSRWPMRIEGSHNLVFGVGGTVVIEAPEGPLRILMVDIVADPRIKRSLMLNKISMICSEATKSGRPIDLVLGDFNSISRNIGFEYLEDHYQLASRSTRGWRGSFPVYAPLYDIDHVWVRNELGPVRCRFFTTLSSDHRGQVVELGPRP